MSGLIENSWILISVSAFILLLYAVLVEIFKEKLSLHSVNSVITLHIIVDILWY